MHALYDVDAPSLRLDVAADSIVGRLLDLGLPMAATIATFPAPKARRDEDYPTAQRAPEGQRR